MDPEPNPLPPNSPSGTSPLSLFSKWRAAKNEKPAWLARILEFFRKEPEDREQLLRNLRSAYKNNLMDAEALSISEGALAASETHVIDIMIPRAQMGVVDIDAPLSEVVPLVIEAAHSRFPVVDGNRDKVVGILLAKDLLRLQTEEDFNLRDYLRPAVFIPESKRLNVLLREFRISHNHMAIVVDEYRGVSGLVTIEDVLEQIVGDIEDEHDFDEAQDNMLLDAAGCYRVKAKTQIEDFNTAIGSNFSDQEFDTVGGLLLRHFGRVPQRDEKIEIEGVKFTVLHADSRRLYTLLVDPECMGQVQVGSTSEPDHSTRPASSTSQ